MERSDIPRGRGEAARVASLIHAAHNGPHAHRIGTEMASTSTPNVSLATLATVFFGVGMASFGGSAAAWLYRDLVQKRQWVSEEEYLSAMTLSQVLPGANPVNMALYVGTKLRGGQGGIAAVLGLVGPPFVVILILGALYVRYGATPFVHQVMGGLIAVGVGMVLQLAAQLAKNIRRIVPAIFALAIFLAVGVLRWPMIPVVLVLAPLSIAAEAYLSRKAVSRG
jgi:chromate transporter